MTRKNKKHRWKPTERTWIRYGLFAAFVVLMATVLPKFQGVTLKYEMGKPWQGSDLRADFEFPIYKTARQIENEETRARTRVKPVFERDTVNESSSMSRILDAVNAMSLDLQAYQELLSEDAEQAVVKREGDFIPKYGLDPDRLLRKSPDLQEWKAVKWKQLSAIAKRIYRMGYIDRPRNQIASELVTLMQEESLAFQAETRTLMSERDLIPFVQEEYPEMRTLELAVVERLALRNMQPNYLLSDSLTRKEEERILNSISPVYGKMDEGELVVQRGELVTPEIDQVLNSYIRARNEKMGEPNFFLLFGGQGMVVLIVTILLGLFIRTNRPLVYFRNRKLALILLILLIMMGMVGLILRMASISLDEFEVNFIFLVPACMVPILLTAFFDIEIGFYGNIVIGLLAGMVIPNGFEYFFIQMTAGSITVYSLTKLRNRGEFFLSLSFILAAYVISYLSYNFFSKGGFSDIQYGNLVLFILNVLLTFITYPLIYIFEKMFKITSDLTYVELLDTNHPLLKELAIKAPGTFQHSLQVANLSEAVVSRIGGNGLQAKVGGLFHDVGKMLNPAYFVENQNGGNPHDALPYEESAKIIVAHVTDGIKLAQEYNLPVEIVDFIRTHHGTSRCEYFFRKFKETMKGAEFDDTNFHYPGPLPFSRETAVVMIVDSIEAAARAMKSHSTEDLRNLIEGIVDAKIRTRQFENANLTFRDLVDIKAVILSNLKSIYHERIEYPKEVRDDEKVAAVEEE